MAIQEFYKNYLNTVPSFPTEPVIFCLNLNKALLPRKLSGTPASVKAGSSL